MTDEKGVGLSDVRFEDLVAEMIRRLGDSPDRDGMKRTPERVAKAMAFLTKGYSETPEEVLGDALFSESHDSMVLVKDIELYSLCEHHMLPFFWSRCTRAGSRFRSGSRSRSLRHYGRRSSRRAWRSS
jgi:GTP cyclohydrolase I